MYLREPSCESSLLRNENTQTRPSFGKYYAYHQETEIRLFLRSYSESRKKKFRDLQTKMNIQPLG